MGMQGQMCASVGKMMQPIILLVRYNFVLHSNLKKSVPVRQRTAVQFSLVIKGSIMELFHTMVGY